MLEQIASAAALDALCLSLGSYQPLRCVCKNKRNAHWSYTEYHNIVLSQCGAFYFSLIAAQRFESEREQQPIGVRLIQGDESV
jgi:hypothetical protein